MKKAILLGALAMVVLASCKKDYTCECVLTGTITGTVTETYNDTKKNATEKCDANDSSTTGQTVECSIK
ncbi:MAG: hypothetical protein EP322_09120 [Bacteroidetes bacterium]|nr:MAG: hypothetical protein EP322_09120 [Bacteroidota bacterium]